MAGTVGVVAAIAACSSFGTSTSNGDGAGDAGGASDGTAVDAGGDDATLPDAGVAEGDGSFVLLTSNTLTTRIAASSQGASWVSGSILYTVAAGATETASASLGTATGPVAMDGAFVYLSAGGVVKSCSIGACTGTYTLTATGLEDAGLLAVTANHVYVGSGGAGGGLFTCSAPPCAATSIFGVGAPSAIAGADGGAVVVYDAVGGGDSGVKHVVVFVTDTAGGDAGLRYGAPLGAVALTADGARAFLTEPGASGATVGKIVSATSDYDAATFTTTMPPDVAGVAVAGDTLYWIASSSNEVAYASISAGAPPKTLALPAPPTAIAAGDRLYVATADGSVYAHGL